MLIKVPRPWQQENALITPEAIFLDRRGFLRGLAEVGAAAGLATALGPLAGCRDPNSVPPPETYAPIVPAQPLKKDARFLDAGRPLTDEKLAAIYNNFYEFGGTKEVSQAAQALPLEGWKVEVGGLVAKPRTYTADELRASFPLEERVYRHRCVEAWAMTVPWLGFPMKALMDAVEPTAAATHVRFTSYYDPNVTKGPTFALKGLPWPYTEGLTIQEMANDLAFFAVGVYGHDLPKQHGAPVRMVVPWKYGFKGAKSIVKIEFVDSQPKTYWNTIAPAEYGFMANVEPDVQHPRWSQKRERLIGAGPSFSWQEVESKKYNGYGEWVAALYGG